MKLLFDENLSRFLVQQLSDCFPNSLHVSAANLSSAHDDAIWSYAQQHDLIIVSKDADFHQRSFLFGAPPKVIWVNAGNCTTGQIAAVLRSRVSQIEEFSQQRDASFLVLGKK